MRSIFRSVLVAAVAVVALSGVGVASASAALPEFVPAEGGKLPITVKGNIKGGVGWSTTGGAKFGCRGGIEATGEITGSKTMPLTVVFEQCPWGSAECHTEGRTKGEALSGSGSLAYINKTTKSVGIVFKLPNTVTLYCSNNKVIIKVEGSLVMPITPVNTRTSEVKLAAKSDNKGHNLVTEYEDEEGKKRAAHLEMNLGTGYLQGALAFGEELKLATSHALTISA